MNLLLTILLCSCMHNTQVFYNKLLDDVDEHTYFITIKVKSIEFSGKVVVENSDLFYYFNEVKKMNKNDYKKMIIRNLERNSSIEFGDTDLMRWNLIKVPVINSINLNAKKGLEQFIKIYFNGNVLKDGITDEERTVIIQKLFEWRILTVIDDETGYLLISK